jgi:integrase
MAAGIRQRHGRGCRAQGRCKCPYEASVYSKRDGKKIRKTFPSLAAATAWRDDARSAVRRHRLRAPAPITVNEVATAWLEGARCGVIRTRSGDPYKPSAIRGYEAALPLRLLPELGRVKLGEVTRTDLQDLVDRLVASGLHPSTIGVTLLPLRAIYKRAMARGEVAVNPTTGLEMPAVRGGRDRIAAPDECAALLEALAAADRTIWATATYAGLRRGELMALRVEDVDLATGVIHVLRGWDTVEGEIATKGRNRRRVPIAGALRDYLDAQIMRLEWSEGLLFGASALSPFASTSVTTRAMISWGWKRVRKPNSDQRIWIMTDEAVQPIGLHECRHTFAS